MLFLESRCLLITVQKDRIEKTLVGDMRVDDMYRCLEDYPSGITERTDVAGFCTAKLHDMRGPYVYLRPVISVRMDCHVLMPLYWVTKRLMHMIVFEINLNPSK